MDGINTLTDIQIADVQTVIKAMLAPGAGDKKISALDAIPSVAAADLLAIVDATDTTTKKATLTQIRAFTATSTTVGNAGSGAEYNSIQDAITASKYDLVVIGNFTETKNVTIGANTVRIKIADTCNMATFRFIGSGAGNLVFESGRLTATLAGGTDVATMSSTGELYMFDTEFDTSGSSGATGIASGSAGNRMHIDNCRLTLYDGTGAGFKNLYNNSSVTNCTFIGGGSSCNGLIDNMNGGIISNITVNGTIENLQNIISVANESAIINGIHSNATNRGIISLAVGANQIDNLNGNIELDPTNTSVNQVSNCYIEDIDLSDSSAGRNKFTNIHNVTADMVIAGNFNQFCNFESDADITINGDVNWFSHARADDVVVNGDANQCIIASFTTYIAPGSNNTYITEVVDTVDASSTDLTLATSKGIYGLFLINALGTPTYTTIQDFIDLSQGASAWDGFDITDGGSGTVDIAAGEGLIKSTNSGIGANFSFDYAGTTALALTDNNTNYIYIDYNSGTPIAAATITFSAINLRTQIMIGRVYRDGSTVHILGTGQFFEEYQTKACKKDFEVYGFQRASGEIMGETGTRNLTVTAGVDYCAHNRITTPAIDTTGADHFDVWNSSASTTPDTAGVSQVDNTNYWNGSIVTALTTNRYGTRFFYRDHDGHIQMQYGTSNTVSVASALAETVPVPPIFLRDFALYIGRIVIQKAAAVFAEITNPFETPEQGTSVTDHGDLAGLTDDDHAQYLLLAGRTGQTVNDDVTFNKVTSGSLILDGNIIRSLTTNQDVNIIPTGTTGFIGLHTNAPLAPLHLGSADGGNSGFLISPGGTNNDSWMHFAEQATSALATGFQLYHDGGTDTFSLDYVTGSTPTTIFSAVRGSTQVTFAGNLLAGGDVGITGTRITKGWFTDLEITNMPTVSGTSINANAVLDLTSSEVTQLATIGDVTTISAGQWVYLGAMNQGVATTDDITVGSLTTSGTDAIYMNGAGIQRLTIHSSDNQAGIGFASDGDATDWVVFSPNGSTSLVFYHEGQLFEMDTSGNATFTGNINAFSLGGKLTGGANEIEGSNFDINGGTIDNVSIGASTPATAIYVDQLSLNDSTLGVQGAGTDLTLGPKGLGIVKVVRNSALGPAAYLAQNDGGDAYFIADRAAGTDKVGLQLKTNNVLKWEIGTDGSVGNEQFELRGTGLWMYIGQSAGNIFFPAVYADTVTSARDLEIQSDGQIGYVSSIRAAKTNIKDFDSSFIYNLDTKMCNMRLKDDDENYTDEYAPEKEYVLIAEDVEKINKDLVFYDEVEGKQELRGVYYKKLIVPLIKCIQEQKERIDKLELRLN